MVTWLYLGQEQLASVHSPRSFSVAGPLAWNSLPPEIKTTSLTLGQFSGWLKTELFFTQLICVSAAVIIFIVRLRET